MLQSSTRRTITDAVVALACAALMAGSWLRYYAMGPRHGRGSIGSPHFYPAAPWSDRIITIGLLGIVICCTGLALRRRWPVPAWVATLVGLGIYLISGGSLPAAVAAAALGLFTLSSRVSTRMTVALGAALAPIFWLRYANLPNAGLDEWETWVGVTTGLAWAIAPALVGLVVIGRTESRRRERDAKLRRAADDERLRIARDVHDIVGHSLSIIALQSGVALRVLDSSPEQARLSLEAIRDTSRRSMAELRQTLAVFRSESNETALTPVPGLSAIDELVSGVRATGRQVGYENTVQVPVPDAVQSVAHRVVQEGLTNAVKHTQAGDISVTIAEQRKYLVVKVVNDGPVLAGITEGTGLRGMRERVAAVSGTLQVRCRASGGVEVAALLPLVVGR